MKIAKVAKVAATPEQVARFQSYGFFVADICITPQNIFTVPGWGHHKIYLQNFNKIYLDYKFIRCIFVMSLIIKL